MTIEDLKGNLLARRANVERIGQTQTSRMLQLEKQLQDAKEQVAASQAVIEELDRTLQLIDQPPPTQ